MRSPKKATARKFTHARNLAASYDNGNIGSASVGLKTGPAHPVTETGQTGQAPVSHVAAGHSETGQAPLSPNHSVNVNELIHKAHSVSFPDSYLGVGTIPEQLSANTENYMQLTLLSSHWNLSIIETVIDEHSKLSSIPSSSGKHIPFGYVFNLTAVAQRLQNCFHMPRNFSFHSLSEALVHSSRDVLVLRFMLSHMSVEVEECSDKSESTVNSVIKKLNSHVEKVKEQAREIHGDKHIFRPWKAICVKSYPMQGSSLREQTFFFLERFNAEKEN